MLGAVQGWPFQVHVADAEGCWKAGVWKLDAADWDEGWKLGAVGLRGIWDEGWKLGASGLKDIWVERS